MAVKIDDIKSLEESNYDELSIMRHPKTKDYIIHVKKRKREQSSSIERKRESFLQKLKYSIDDIKVIYIVRHFLKNHTISGINLSNKSVQNTERCVRVEGDRTTLMFEAEKNQLLIHECMKKYILDRELFMEQHKNDVLQYEIMVFPGVQSYRCLSDSINLRLDSDGKKISDTDRIFLKGLILQRLKEQGEVAELIAPYFELNHQKVYYEPCCDLVCGNLVMRFYSEVLREIAQWAMEYYNDTILNNNKKL